MKYNVTTIEQYLESIPEERKEIIQKIIGLVEEFFPGIEGNIKYDMPTFNPVCSVASQKHYISVYIHRVDLVEKYRRELRDLKVGKSCIRFTKPEQFPEAIIRKIFSDISKRK